MHDPQPILPGESPVEVPHSERGLSAPVREGVPDAVKLKHPLAKAISGHGVVRKEVAFTVARYRFEFTCECGAPVWITPDHNQQWCTCGVLYTMTSIAGAAIEYLQRQRLAAAQAPEPPPPLERAPRPRQDRPSRSQRKARAQA